MKTLPYCAAGLLAAGILGHPRVADAIALPDSGSCSASSPCLSILNNSTSSNGFAVQGDAGPGIGVKGTAITGYGVYGTAGNIGVFGVANAVGVKGQANASGHGVEGTAV